MQMVATCSELEKTDIWKGIISKQMDEEITLKKAQIDKEHRLLQQILTTKHHDIQRKELSSKHDR